MAWLVFGLGNPGADYRSTRHNIGQMVIDQLAQAHSLNFKSHKSNTDIAAYKIDDQDVIIAKSLGFMNESGGPIKSLCNFYKVAKENLILIHDELDIPFNTIRIKLGGGDNGHNGLKSATGALGADYFRIRMGIGRPIGQQDPADFVLKNFSSVEKPILPEFISNGADATEYLIKNGLSQAQSKFNN